MWTVMAICIRTAPCGFPQRWTRLRRSWLRCKARASPGEHTGISENLFSADFAYLQDFYRQINENGTSKITAVCPECNEQIEVDMGKPGE